MLKVIMARKKLEMYQREETELRSKLNGFAKREAELAAQVEAAKTEADLSAAAAAVAELEEAKKTTKERLQTIKDECDALLQEIEDAEAAAAAAGAGDAGTGEPEARSRTHSRSGAAFLKRCQDFQRTGRMVYENAVDMVKRAAVLSASNGVTGPTSVSGINDAVGTGVSAFIDLMRVVDCTGMDTYKAVYEDSEAEANDGTEGKVPTESEPGFGVVELTPDNVDIISYISRAIRKQSPLQYEAKVNEAARKALRRKLSKKAVTNVLASDLNTTMALTGATGAALFTPTLLSNIILSYGGDEGVEGAAVLTLNKHDLKAFAGVRGTNEFLPVYSITPDTANPSCGIIKDNNGLSCRYCLSKDVTSLAQAALTADPVKTMFYGNPQCAELAMWGGVEVIVNEGYKFGEGLLTIRGEALGDADVTVKNGFVVVTATKSA